MFFSRLSGDYNSYDWTYRLRFSRCTTVRRLLEKSVSVYRRRSLNGHNAIESQSNRRLNRFLCVKWR